MFNNKNRKRKADWSFFNRPDYPKQAKHYHWSSGYQNSGFNHPYHGYDQRKNHNQIPQQSYRPKTSKSYKFEKRRGTTNLGQFYEEYFPITVILKLLQNAEVEDFRISTNDYQFGAFDDFILEVEYINKTTEKYAIQLKHKENFTLTIETLEKIRQFCILNYYQAFQNCGMLLSDYKVILFTNAKFEAHDNHLVVLKKDEEGVKIRIIECAPSSLMNTGKTYQFQLDTGNSEEIKQKYKNFFAQFFLYTNQMNTRQLKENIVQSFGMVTSNPSVSDKFLKFISEWSLKDGIKDKLTKNIIVKVLTLHIVEKHIQPLIFCEVNKEKTLLQKIISHFNITAFHKESLEKVIKLWGDIESLLEDYDIKKINEILGRFQISTKYITDIGDLTDEESTKLLWVMDKCPLIIKDYAAVCEAVKIGGKESKFVLLTDEFEDEKLQPLTVFKTLSDLKHHNSTNYDNVKNLPLRIFKKETNLANLIKEDDAFEKLITTNEIVKMTENPNLIDLKEEELCFPYIERHLYKIIIDLNYLQKLDKNTKVLISNVGDEKKNNGEASQLSNCRQ